MRRESRKETSKSSLAARARTLQAAGLGWLAGFPLGVGEGSVAWLAVPAHGPAQEVSVDRHHLSRATHTLNKLRGELAPALPLLLGEPAVWLESAEHRLALLKRAVHQGEPLPEDLFAAPLVGRAQREQASRLAAGAPRVRPLLAALSWIHAGDPARVRACLEVVPEWRAGWDLLADRLGERGAILTLVRLLELAADHGRERVQALALCLFDERSFDAALQGGWKICGQILRGLGKRAKEPLPVELPSGTLGRELAGWCEDLVQESHRAGQVALRLFALASPLPLAERWSSPTRRTSTSGSSICGTPPATSSAAASSPSPRRASCSPSSPIVTTRTWISAGSAVTSRNGSRSAWAPCGRRGAACRPWISACGRGRCWRGGQRTEVLGKAGFVGVSSDHR